MKRFKWLCLIGVSWSLAHASSALADETLPAQDNGEVACQASRSELTRIALRDDEFVSVSRIETGDERSDIAIVHEPRRGDLYVSVPEGYSRPNISFFGTTKAGFVYKFNCRVSDIATHQVFVENVALAQQGAPRSLEEESLALVSAMFEQRVVPGYDISDSPRAPVNVGQMRVQLVSQYEGPVLQGKVLRIENSSADTLELNEALVAGEGALAVSIANPTLAAGQATSAFIVVPTGAE